MDKKDYNQMTRDIVKLFPKETESLYYCETISGNSSMQKSKTIFSGLLYRKVLSSRGFVSGVIEFEKPTVSSSRRSTGILNSI